MSSLLARVASAASRESLPPRSARVATHTNSGVAPPLTGHPGGVHLSKHHGLGNDFLVRVDGDVDAPMAVARHSQGDEGP